MIEKFTFDIVSPKISRKLILVKNVGERREHIVLKLISYILFYEGHWVIVENVPASVCQQCGERLFAPKVVEELQNTIWSKQSPVKKIETPVFDLAY